MAEKILCVFEGSKTEPYFFSKAQEHFFKDSQVELVYSCFEGELYQLCRLVAKDTYIDLIELLRERNPHDAILLENEFSEIHLFFDHEAHSHPELTHDKYQEMLREIVHVFDNETDSGLISISYPMVEALKDCRKLEDGGDTPCDDCLWDLSQNTRYKTVAAERSTFLAKSRSQWLDVIGINLLKARQLILSELNLDIEYENLDCITQENILDAQYEKHILPLNEVVILSAIPFFLYGYFGRRLFDEIDFEGLNVSCMYFCS